ncbi:hypothetical protein FANTH_13958 [Fusarium anthophilum]|uniref:Uncharacterized protein n=1 Tax=Fusarium anthophilum TaxID=48485 RepID=A0A8H4YLL5_9HYPO|nr:hypothetical protein FANTH_13958 [Fusarium anthophilum]
MVAAEKSGLATVEFHNMKWVLGMVTVHGFAGHVAVISAHKVVFYAPWEWLCKTHWVPQLSSLPLSLDDPKRNLTPKDCLRRGMNTQVNGASTTRHLSVEPARRNLCID